MPSMFIGGAERSLLGLLDNIDYETYDVSLFLYRNEGEFLPFISEKVKILPPISQYATFDVPIKQLLFSRQWFYGLLRIWAKISVKLHCLRTKEEQGVWMSMQYISKSLLPALPKIEGEYDLAVSFLGVPDVLLEKVSAKKKIAWNHTDYTALFPDKKRDRELYSKLDYLISVSEPCTEQFLKVYPEFADKAITIENVLSIEFIKKQADEVICDLSRSGHEIKILSIGRYSHAKNFDNVPDICRRIRSLGVDVIWYIIGYGGDEAFIKSKIEEAHMENYVVLLGKKDNPYPYIKQCDIYVQPSRYEGKSVAVREAQILHKPVVITNYATASSQLEDGVDGVIVPMDNEGCARKIAELLKDKVKLEQLAGNTYNKDYSNCEEIEKIYEIINQKD